MKLNRRNFIQSIAASHIALSSAACATPKTKDTTHKKIDPNQIFSISISQWCFHKAILGDSKKDYKQFTKTLHSDPDAVLWGDMDPREIVVKAREMDVSYIDLVNVLWFGHAKDKPWLNQFKTMANSEGVNFVCLMTNQAGLLGSNKSEQREEAIQRHLPWLDAAAELGCTQLRVNAEGKGTYLEQLNQNAESLNKLGDYGAERNIEILVENHGHPSNNGAWLAMLMEKTAHNNVGVLADFDNFFMGGWGHKPQRRYDRIQGMEDLAPYTRAASAKSYAFDENGQETSVDFLKCMKLLIDAGFSGPVSAEYEGKNSNMSEFEGTLATVELLRRVRSQLS